MTVDDVADVVDLPISGRVAKRKPQRRAANDDGKPVIQIGTDLPAMASALSDAMATDPTLYQRDGELVHVTRTTEIETNAKSVWRAGTPRVRMVRPAHLVERAAICAQWEKWQKPRGEEGQWVPALPSRLVCDVFAARGEWPQIRPLVAVTECPFMRPDGSICTANGYDRRTGVLLESDLDIGTIPEKPTQDDARAAWKALREPFSEFPWTNEASLSAAVAGILTMVGRPRMSAVPALLINKTTPGTGGTLVTDIISLATTGRNAPRLSWPPNDEELEKVLGALALGAANLVCFDNIKRPFTGAPIDKALTCEDRVQFRILGQSETPAIQWRALMIGSGNNILVASDTIDRVMNATMETDSENPRERTGFRIQDLRAWTRAHRAELVRAALIVLRAYLVAGCPSQGTPQWGSFESFAALIPPAIVFAGGADPMGTRLRADSAGDPEFAAMTLILSRLPTLTTGPTSVREIVALLYPPERVAGKQVAPDGNDDLRAAVETLAPIRAGRSVEPLRLGQAFRTWKGRVIGSKRLISDEGRNNKNVAQWSVASVTPARDASDARDVSAHAPGGCKGSISDSAGAPGRNVPRDPRNPRDGGPTTDLDQGAAE